MPPMRNLQAREIRNGLDLLAEPAAHLGAGVAAGEADHVRLLEELVAELLAAALVPPGVLLARVEAERHRGVDRPGRILADVVVGDGVAHLDRAVRGRVERLQAGDDFAGREHLDLELVVGHLGDVLRHLFAAAIDGIERLREARRHAPLDLGRGLRNRRRGHCGGRRRACCRHFQRNHDASSSGLSLLGRFPELPHLLPLIPATRFEPRRTVGA